MSVVLTKRAAGESGAGVGVELQCFWPQHIMNAERMTGHGVVKRPGVPQNGRLSFQRRDLWFTLADDTDKSRSSSEQPRPKYPSRVKNVMTTDIQSLFSEEENEHSKKSALD